MENQYEQKIGKKVAILFSGGLDSTYLVWKNLKEGNIVFPIYVEIENNEIKTILEKNRIELLWKEFHKDDSFNLKPIQYAVKVGVHANEGSLYFKQMPIWIFAVVFLQGMDVDEVQIGYVSNDDAISYLDDIQNIYKSYQAISEPMKPLVFPLTKEKKYMVAQELPEQYRKYVFSCEMAKIKGSKDAEVIEYEPCCECASCKTIIANDYYKIKGFSNIYEKKLIEQHAHELLQQGYKIIDKEGKNYFENCYKVEQEKKPYQLEFDFINSGNDILFEDKKNGNG
jgi:hypothetical protein